MGQARNPYPQIEFLTGNGKKKKKIIKGGGLTSSRKSDLPFVYGEFL